MKRNQKIANFCNSDGFKLVIEVILLSHFLLLLRLCIKAKQFWDMNKTLCITNW